jgi:hypothetical protein
VRAFERNVVQGRGAAVPHRKKRPTDHGP